MKVKQIWITVALMIILPTAIVLFAKEANASLLHIQFVLPLGVL